LNVAERGVSPADHGDDPLVGAAGGRLEVDPDLPASRKPNPCTERTATIGSVTTIPGVIVANEPTVAPTHASDPTAATTNSARHRRSPSASRR
jgi:hypothetical protein